MAVTFTAAQVAEVELIIAQARKDFREDSKNWRRDRCRNAPQCDNVFVPVAQHFNDVGGPDTLMCEGCYIDAYTYFSLSEQQEPTE